MDKRGKRQAAAIFGGMGFYIALLVCVVAAGVVGYYALLSDEETPEVPDEPVQTVTDNEPGTSVPVSETEDTHEVLSQENVAVLKPVITPETVDVPDESDEETAVTGEIELEVPVSGEVTVPEQPQESTVSVQIVLPLQGETISVFSADRLMYDATLDDWRTHDGIDIHAAAGTPVVAAAAGKVISVGEDDRLGVNVVIEHAGGYATTYASLHPETLVEVGEEVEAGAVIGTVGNTSLSESGIGAHLHFSVTRNGELIDPEAYLPKES